MKTKKMITVMSLMMVLGTGTMMGNTVNDKKGDKGLGMNPTEMGVGMTNGSKGNVKNDKTFNMCGDKDMGPVEKGKKDKGGKPVDCRMPEHKGGTNVVKGVTTGIVVGTVIGSIIGSLVK